MATLRDALRKRLAGTTPAIGFSPIAPPPAACDTGSTPPSPGPIYLSETPVESALVPAGAGPSAASPSDPVRIENKTLSILNRPIDPAEAAALRGYLDAATAEATRDGYRADLAHFADWCVTNGHTALPAESATVARYLAALAQAGYKVATLERRLAAISSAHQAQGLDTPTRGAAVRTILQGIKRAHGTAQDGKAPLLPDDLRRMVALLDASPAGRRDRALLLLGFAGAFRRSELVSLDLADLQMRREGLVVTLRRSKTDQEGQGAQKGIPRGRGRETCPVRAVEAWIKAAGITEGPLFRPVAKAGRVSAQRLADFHLVRLIKRLTAAIGLDPELYGGHSLRVGLATAAALAGAEERDIMRQTGHKSEKMVRRYIRDARLFEGNAADGLL